MRTEKIKTIAIHSRGKVKYYDVYSGEEAKPEAPVFHISFGLFGKLKEVWW